MLLQKILKIEALKLPEIAFHNNLIGIFFKITLVIFSYKVFYFHCESLFYIQYRPTFIVSQSELKWQTFKLFTTDARLNRK